MVEVDENGRDLNQLNRKTVPLYSKSKMFSVSQTNNMFGQTDNRLGGSKTAYKKDYKQTIVKIIIEKAILQITNIFKVNFLIKFKKIEIVRYEKMKENITAIIAKKFNSELPSL